MKTAKNKKSSKSSKSKNSSKNILKGTLSLTKSGLGYVETTGLPNDIIIKPDGLGKAFEGDLVEVAITKQKTNQRRVEGKIITVIKRKQTEFVGTIDVNKHYAFFIADSQKKMPDFYIENENLNGAVDGQKVIVEFVRWEKGDKKPIGKVLKVLKEEDLNNKAMADILTDNGFKIGFSNEALKEAAGFTGEIEQTELMKRIDFRGILTFTIDPVDAKDFDDAISFEILKNGNYKIGVHIADVSHFVRTNSILDKEAFENATSVYLPDRVNPMLPEKISNELCSLRPNEDKYTFSAIFELDKKANVKNYHLAKTIIHSKHRFTYEDVQNIIETKKGKYENEILTLNHLAQTLRKQRFNSGAINFSSQEVRFILDDKAKPVGITIKESKQSHQLIEEFMLLANKYVAQHIAQYKVKRKSIPFPYRIHDSPDEEKLKNFASYTKKLGYHIETKDIDKISFSFNKMLEDSKNKPEHSVLESLGIRTMAKAIYSTENIGHYGLGFEHYCHFTSPIRRYPDILVHRILESCLHNNPIVDAQLEEKCKHCSERERAAVDSERAANKYKQVEFMQEHLGETFDGVISGVSSFGFWVETLEHKCEGLVSINDLLTRDNFKFIESDYALVGLRSGKKFKMGDKVKIRVIAANLFKRQLDYELVKSGY